MTVHFQGSTEVVEQFDTVDRVTRTYERFGKRVFDIIFVALIALPVGAVVLLLAAVIALDGHNPFFFQRRVGRDGRVFWMVKLRSMVVNSDEALRAHIESNPAAKEEWDRFQKLSDDPRITRIGRIIRKLSLDELPQFWNVLTGSMSVVGPRPMLPSQRELYPGQAYFRKRPGETGFWQIGNRSKTTFAARAHFDSSYYAKLSLRTAIAVVLKTVVVVLRGTGV